MHLAGAAGCVGCVAFSALVAFFIGRQRPEKAVGNHVAHARAKAGVERLIEEGQAFADGSVQFGARGQQRGQCGRQRVASADEADFEALELFAGDGALRRREHVVQKLLGRL